MLHQEPTAIPSRKKKVCQRLVGSLLQDCLPVKFQDVKYPKHEIFVRINIKYTYFSNIVCHQFFLLLKL